jgi:LAO/AO transport system kinase
MQHHALDSGVFIRSMATRGHLGGLAKAAPAVIAALKLVGFDYLLIETVGVGQSEVEVATNSDVTVVVIAPGMGDSIQAAKAGVFEIADIFVVNKSDRDGADASVRDLRQMLEMSFDKQNTPIIKTVATTGLGVKELLDKANEL